MEQNELCEWLQKHIIKLRVKYDDERNLEKKIVIGARMRAMVDVLSMIKNHKKQSI